MYPGFSSIKRGFSGRKEGPKIFLGFHANFKNPADTKTQGVNA